MYKCFISSFCFSIFGNRIVSAGLYLINPYISQASLIDPLNTFNIFAKYALEKSCFLQNSEIKVFKVTFVIDINL